MPHPYRLRVSGKPGPSHLPTDRSADYAAHTEPQHATPPEACRAARKLQALLPDGLIAVPYRVG